MCAYAADWVLEYLSTRIVYVCIHLTSCLSTPTRWLSKNIRVSPFGTTFPRPTLINYVRIDLLRSLHTAHAREKPEEFTTTTITTTTTTTRNSSGIFQTLRRLSARWTTPPWLVPDMSFHAVTYIIRNWWTELYKYHCCGCFSWLWSYHWRPDVLATGEVFCPDVASELIPLSASISLKYLSRKLPLWLLHKAAILCFYGYWPSHTPLLPQ